MHVEAAKSKGIGQGLKATEARLVHPAYIPYSVSGHIQKCHLTAPNYQKQFQTAFAEKPTMFGKNKGELASYLDAGRTAVTRHPVLALMPDMTAAGKRSK